MSYWNHRVMRHTEAGSSPPEEVVWYAVHEVYYYDDGTVINWSQNPDSPQGDDLSDLAESIRLMAQALKHPVLDYDTGEEIQAAPGHNNQDENIR